MKVTEVDSVCGIMRRIAWWLALGALIAIVAGRRATAQGVSTTTVQGTVYLATGQPGGGTLVVSWPSFTTAAGQAIAADHITVVIPADGFVSVSLAPNQGATPAGEYYTATYYMSDGSTNTEYWIVPAAAQATIAQVRAQAMPATQAVQAVTKAYVDQSIAELQLETGLTTSGGTLTGPLMLSGDPTQPLQAADKHYVDSQMATAMPLSGGAMTGPLTLSNDPTQAMQAADKEYVDAAAANAWPAAVLRVDEFAGADFGARLQACLSAVNTTYGGICDARNFTGNQTISSDLTISAANTTVLLPCATIATANHIAVTAGTRNAVLRGCSLRGGNAAGASQGGTVFAYSGAAALIQVGDPTYATDTVGFHLDNLAINTTAGGASAVGLAAYRTQEIEVAGVYLLGNSNQTGITLDGTGNYTSGTFIDDQLDGFQIAVNAIGHQVSNPATTDWMNASSFVRLHINCPTSSGNPIAGTYGLNLQQGDGNTITGGDVESCATALHLGPNAQNNTIVGLRTENSTMQIVADTGSSYNDWIGGEAISAGQLSDSGTRNSFQDSFHRGMNGLNGDWYGSQQDATLTNHYRLGTGAGNERGLLNRYQTDYGYRWTTGLSDAASGEQFYEILDELNNVNRLSIGQYNNGQSSTNDQTAINSAGTGAVVLNGSNNAGTGGVVIGSGGASAATVATVSNAGNAQFNGTLQVGGTAQFGGAATIRNNADAEVDANLWPGLTASQKGAFIYKDWNGNNEWSMVKDASNNWALNSPVSGLDSFKAYQSANGGDTYVNAVNSSGAVRVNYESGSGAAFEVYGGNSSTVYASFTGAASIAFPGLAASSGHSCLQVDTSGNVTNTGSACGSASGGSGTVNSSNAGYIAYYPSSGTSISGVSSVPVAAGGTGSATAAGALSNLGALPLTGGTLTGALAGTSASFSGSVSPATVQPSSTPTLDIRNPAFAGGAVCNDSTDIGPALQAAVNALPAAGGNIQIVSSPTACYWANPNTITWPSLTGAINLYINGTLDLGTSFVTPANDLMNIYCMGGSGESQFVPGGSTCTMKLNTTAGAPTGTLGTAVSTTPGTAATVTFTPSTMHGLSAGTGISVADSVSCTISSATVSSGKVTVTLSAACHIPPGVPVTVAGSSNSTFNCAYAGGSYPQQCLATASDYGLNTITYNDSSASGTSSGGTITGLNEDSPENVLISSCTTSTCTATFYRPHTAQAVWGVDTLVIGGSTHPMQIVGLGLSNYWGTSLWMDGGYGSRIDGVGITNTGQCSGTYSAFDADVETSFVHFEHDAFLYGCSPWALRFSQESSEPGGGTGYMHIDNSFVAGIKVDHGAEGIYVHNLVAEQTPRGIISFDPNYYAWTGSGSVPQFSLDGVGFQDNPNGFPQTLLYYLSSPSTATSASSAASGYARITNSRQTQAKYVVNDYFQGGLYDDGSNIGYGINTQPGVVGIHDDGITFDGEIRGEGASMGLSAVPYQTATILPVSSWTGSCTNTTGALDPQGGTGAVALSWTTNSICYSTVSNYTYTPAAGDTVIFGGWVKTTTPGAGAQAGNGTDFQVSNNASSHFTWAGTTYSTVGSGAYDSNLSGDWWHPVVGIATVATSDGTANQIISLQLTGNSTEVIDYFAPFMIVIPASANVPLAEINRYRTQLLHGCVPSNYNGVGIPATCDAVASAGYYLLNPAGGSPNVIIPGTATLPYVGFKTYSGTGSPTDTCASTANTGAIEINATPTAYQCSNATGSYAWNGLGGGGTYTGSSPIVVTGTVISCPTCGTSTGTSVQVNGGSTLGTANLANSSGAGEIDFANPSGSTVNATVHNPTISGVSLGSNLNTLTFGTHLTGTSYNGSAGVTLGTDATSANTASTIVARDGSENFSAGTITAALNGNASSATTAGNVTATSNTTLTSLTNLAGVGTIGTGTWQGTAIAPAYGGTGQNESSATGVGHWSSGVYSVSTTLPSGLSAANMSLTTPALGTPASGVITNLTGTCTSCSVGGNATTATGISTSGTANQVWGMNAGGTAQGWQSVASGGGNVSTSGTVTTGYIPKWASATTVTNSGLDDGVTEGVGGLTYTYSAGPVFTLNNTAATGSTDECFEGVDAENSSSSGNYGELCFNSGYGAHFYLQHQPTAALTTGYTFMDANSNLLALLDAFNGNFYVRGGLGVGSSAIIIIPSTATLPYVGFKTYSGSGTPTDTCSATANTGAIEINATPTAYQCSNATGSYAWNGLGGSSSGVTSIAATSPIQVSGATGAVTISCPTCYSPSTYVFTTSSYPSGIGCSGSAGSYTCTAFPTGSHVCTVTVIGAGAGGGSGAMEASGTNAYGGGGGAGGSTGTITVPCSWFGGGTTATVTVTVGAHGSGGAAQTTNSTAGNNGTAGGSSAFTGGTGYGGLSSNGGNAGSGGTTSSGTGGATSTSGGILCNPGAAANGSSTTGGSATFNGALPCMENGSGGGGVNTSATAGSGGGPASTSSFSSFFVKYISNGSGGTACNAGGSPSYATQNVYPYMMAFGGAGGGGCTSGAAGTGGAGMFPGGGGGGGGGAENGYSSGAGGNGGDGYVQVIVQ